MEELKTASAASFATFTYDDSTIPFSSSGLMTLNYEDLQKFWKRLRKANPDEKIKYFAAGEYGSRFHRPHYHSIIFNCPDRSSIEALWPHGYTHIGDVNEASIYYTLKYAIKKAGKEIWDDPDDDRKPEKACMSQGLGLSFITPEMVQYYKNNLDAGVTKNGNTLPLPRYYRDKIFTSGEKRARVKKMETLMEKRLDKTTSPKFPEQVRYLNRLNQAKAEKTD